MLLMPRAAATARPCWSFTASCGWTTLAVGDGDPSRITTPMVGGPTNFSVAPMAISRRAFKPALSTLAGLAACQRLCPIRRLAIQSRATRRDVASGNYDSGFR